MILLIVLIFAFAYILCRIYRTPRRHFSTHTSDVIIDKRRGVVFKRVRVFVEKDVYEREVYILQLLNSLRFQWCPRLLATDPTDRVIVMSYCGEPMTPRNQPVDAKQQFSKIVDDMRSIGMRHNDIKKGQELLVQGGKLSLCDYGWATIDGSLSCGIGLWNGKKPHGVIEDTSIKF